MGVISKKEQKIEPSLPEKKGRIKVSRIKLEFDSELESLSGTILFPEKLKIANKFLHKTG
jgi:hypothetical protein